MDGRHKPDPQPGNENNLNDDEIIDLSLIVEPENDEAIIDLVDVATTFESDIAEPEPDIPLPRTRRDPPPAEADEEVIDLVEVTAVPETDIAKPEPDIPVTGPEEKILPSEAEEEIIDLFETVEAPAADAVTPPSDEARDDVIDLLDAVEPEPIPAEVDRSDAVGLEERIINVDKHQFTPADAVAPVAATTLSEPAAAESVPLTEAQVEAALERAIERIYGEKIEHLMIRTIEKTVEKEIEKIKIALLEDDDGMRG